MATVPQDQSDSRFDEAESDVERGEPWMFRESDAPNPLTIVATGWSTGNTSLGTAEFLSGVDRDGKVWSVLVGNVVLRKRLVEGLIEEWSDEQKDFVITDVLGRVRPGEVVSLKYTGDRQGTKFEYPTFRVSRKPPAGAASPPQTATVPEDAGPVDDDFPY